MTDIAIRVSNLSKCYQVYDNPRDRLKQFVIPILCRAFQPLLKALAARHSLLTTSHSPIFYKEFSAPKDILRAHYRWFPRARKGFADVL